MNKQELYVPFDMDMLEIAMEIQSQFKEDDEVYVYYEGNDEYFEIKDGDFLGKFTLEGLRLEGYLS
jgi:hypothetical protein